MSDSDIQKNDMSVSFLSRSVFYKIMDDYFIYVITIHVTQNYVKITWNKPTKHYLYLDIGFTR